MAGNTGEDAEVGTLIRLASALPLAFVTALFLIPLTTGQYINETDAPYLARLMELEFVVALSGLFLVLPLLIVSNRLWVNIVRVVIFILLSAGFFVAVRDEYGWRGVLDYALLLFACYGGFTLFERELEKRRRLSWEAGARWILQIVILIPLIVVFDMPERAGYYSGSEYAIPLGATFFSCLLALEVFVYSWLPNRIWSRIRGA